METKAPFLAVEPQKAPTEEALTESGSGGGVGGWMGKVIYRWCYQLGRL